MGIQTLFFFISKLKAITYLLIAVCISASLCHSRRRLTGAAVATKLTPSDDTPLDKFTKMTDKVTDFWTEKATEIQNKAKIDTDNIKEKAKSQIAAIQASAKKQFKESFDKLPSQTKKILED